MRNLSSWINVALSKFGKSVLMARWRILTVSAATVFLFSFAWWSLDVLLTRTAPALGPIVIVSPQIVPPPQPTKTPVATPVATPPPPSATVVAPAPPPPAGDNIGSDDYVETSDNSSIENGGSDSGSGWYDELRGEWYDDWADFVSRGHYDDGQYRESDSGRSGSDRSWHDDDDDDD